jgi:hypothetical protein
MDDAAGHLNQLGTELDALVATGLSRAEAELVLAHRRSRLVNSELGDHVDDGPTVLAIGGNSSKPALINLTDDGGATEFDLTIEDPTALAGYDVTAEPVARVPFGGRSRWLALAVAVGLALISGLLVRWVLRGLFDGTLSGIAEETILAVFFLATVPFAIGYFAWCLPLPWQR